MLHYWYIQILYVQFYKCIYIYILLVCVSHCLLNLNPYCVGPWSCFTSCFTSAFTSAPHRSTPSVDWCGLVYTIIGQHLLSTAGSKEAAQAIPKGSHGLPRRFKVEAPRWALLQSRGWVASVAQFENIPTRLPSHIHIPSSIPIPSPIPVPDPIPGPDLSQPSPICPRRSKIHIKPTKVG
jgi:hypothetical protein